MTLPCGHIVGQEDGECCGGNATIDLTPDANGYAAIGAMFVAQARDDFKASRREPATFILGSIIDLAFGIGYAAGTVNDKAETDRLRDAFFARIGGPRR